MHSVCHSGLAQASLKRRRQALAAAAKALDIAKSGGGSPSSGAESGSTDRGLAIVNRICIDDGNGSCWVTFDTNSQGKRVLLGRGAFAKVLTDLPCCVPSICIRHSAAATLLPLRRSLDAAVCSAVRIALQPLTRQFASTAGVSGQPRRRAKGRTQGAVSDRAAGGHTAAAQARDSAAAAGAVRCQRGAVLRRIAAAQHRRCARHGVRTLALW